jgi:hypothetical protein
LGRVFGRAFERVFGRAFADARLVLARFVPAFLAFRGAARLAGERLLVGRLAERAARPVFFAFF